LNETARPAPLVTVAPILPSEHELALAMSLHDHQIRFVASNAKSLAQAAEDPASVPLLVRADGKPVGFAMYTLDKDDGNYWIYRFMIDRNSQSKGYGRAAIRMVAGLIFESTDAPRVLLGVVQGNADARRLYERAGFADAGYQVDGEDIMIIERSAWIAAQPGATG